MFVLLISFIVYLYTLFGCVAPYRDTGEMVSVAHTLGIAHPPGYPLYTLLSKAWLILVPFGSEGYRMNVLSAAGGAVTAWLFYKLLVSLSIKRTTAALASLVFAFSYLQWYLSLVSEMYTLNTLFSAALILLLWKLLDSYKKQAPRTAARPAGAGPLLFFTAFVFGAGLGVRMDLLMAAPAALVVLYSLRKELKPGDMILAGIFFAAGFSVFLYLPLRSNTGPLLDWNHPATLERFWGTIGRKTHGGTLDLISAPYAAGANFGSSMKFYFKHFLTGFAYAGPALALFGFMALWKKERVFCLALASAWLFSGPVFIYLANMPPNPHALAILEAHFLMPNLFAAVFFAAGIDYAMSALSFSGAAAAPLLCAALLAVQLFNGSRDLQKRDNLVAYDYAKNVLRSLPENSIVVMKKDVQLFALWNRQYVEGERKDSAVVGQGLSGSPWYQTAFARVHPDVGLGALRNASDWKTLAEMNPGKGLFFSPDADYSRPQGYVELPRGLLNLVTPKTGTPDQFLLGEIFPYRGKYFYGDYREFFTPDIIEDYARAHIALGRYYMDEKRGPEARREFETSLRLQPFFPQVYSLIAYTYVAENNYPAASKYYREAAAQFDKLLDMAAEYNTLEDTRDGIRRDISDAYISLGVCSEKALKDDESLSYYSQATSVWPGQARAYFNRSVIFWRRGDWPQVIRELEQALRVDPNFKEAAYYLETAKRKAAH